MAQGAVKQRLLSLATVLIGIVLGAALVEAAATAWITAEDGRYTPAPQLFERTQNVFVRDITRGTSCRYIDTLYPHPYLAFVHHANPPCGLPNINNTGLFNQDFPALKRDDRYVVLLTGGSVAAHVGQTYPAPAPRYLEQELNRRFVSPNGRPFLVLNGGDGAWHQPQQFILFSLFASSVDAVVTLDGYNEHFYFMPDNASRLERPASNFIDINPLVDKEKFGDAAIGWTIGRLAGAVASVPILRRSHAAYLVVRRIENLARSKDIAGSGEKTDMASMFAIPKEILADPGRRFEFQLDLYRKYMRGIDLLARRYDVRAAFFLQPVPAWGKTLTEQEKINVGDLSYGPLYRRMVAGLMALGGEGLPIFDLGDVVKDEAGTLYRDDIHFDPESPASRGYTLMAGRMAEQIGQAWGLKPRN